MSALVGATLIGVASIFAPLSPPVAAAATTVLVMGGTGHPLSTPPDTIDYVESYTSMARNNYVSPSSTASRSTGIPVGPYNTVAVITPEEDAPTFGTLTLRESIAEGLANLQICISSNSCVYDENIGSASPSPIDTFVIFGYSQSAAIAMLEKAQLASQYAPGEGPDVTFLVIGNSRPNGGLVSRDVGGIINQLLFGRKRSELIADPVLTNTQYATVDVALQYDGFADFPRNPLNLLADLNAYLGILQLHPTYNEHNLSKPGVVDQGQYGDTNYYLISTPVLPLLMPLQKLGPAGHVLADALDPLLRVMVETGYDRTMSPGQPAPFDVSYFPNPIKTTVSLLAAIPTGLDNALDDIVDVRPFGTQRPGPYGIGGPSVDYLNSDPASTADPSAGTAFRDLASHVTPRGVGRLQARSTSPATSARPNRPAASRSTITQKPTGSPTSSKSSRGQGSWKRAT
ncbi:PE-PPE domain-containing protein [Mycolicibacterium vinylchloridicum]|uniref:PE-PPE domain-containing protein n=1 Tax=Mycolicibacterium vinylchloridicum TaxID=2736928 RepID=UPI002D7FCE02|nr:PE-PPE domain-containing protein [Mycolicibacterium vinylchloridicum]